MAGVVSGGDEIAAQRADVEISEDAAAHQLFVPVFGPDAIEKPRLEPRSHGFHVESVGQVAILAKLDQLCLQAGVGLGIGRFENEIAGTWRRRSRRGGAAVTVRSGKVANGLASHEVGDELSLLDEGNALGFDAFVVDE